MNIITIAILSLLTGIVSGAIIAGDLVARPQRMWIMNIVWPITALYSGPLGLWAYFRIGRRGAGTGGGGDHGREKSADGRGGKSNEKPFWQSVLTSALHCGGGCTVGDLLAEVFLGFVPVMLAGSRLLGGWLIDYIFAFSIGILFQYYAIKPMKMLTPRQAIFAALKADALSLTSWQIGMYGWMAISIFLVFHRGLKASDPLFWWMMQVAMLCGLAFSYPVNWWLLKKGIKERM
jgi:hypothetical protein